MEWRGLEEVILEIVGSIRVRKGIRGRTCEACWLAESYVILFIMVVLLLPLLFILPHSLNE